MLPLSWLLYRMRVLQAGEGGEVGDAAAQLVVGQVESIRRLVRAERSGMLPLSWLLDR